MFNTRDFNRRLHILWMALQTFFTILLAVLLLGVPYWFKKRRPIPKDFEIPNKCQYETNVDELENGDDGKYTVLNIFILNESYDMLVINNFTYSFSNTHTHAYLELIERREDSTAIQVADNGNNSNCSDDEDIDLRTKLINHHTDKDTT